MSTAAFLIFPLDFPPHSGYNEEKAAFPPSDCEFYTKNENLNDYEKKKNITISNTLSLFPHHAHTLHNRHADHRCAPVLYDDAADCARCVEHTRGEILRQRSGAHPGGPHVADVRLLSCGARGAKKPKKKIKKAPNGAFFIRIRSRQGAFAPHGDPVDHARMLCAKARRE